MNAKENLLRAIGHNKPQWVPNGMENVVNICSPVVERPALAGKDDFGVEWSLEEEVQGGTYPSHGGNPVTDLLKWREQTTIPDIDQIDWSSVEKQAAAIDREDFLVSGFVEMGLFERSYLLLGMNEALIAYLTDPALMAELVSVVADYKIALIQKFDDIADLDMIWYGDDWGTQNNLFLPPEIWREIIKPNTQRIYNCMKERNIIINQHSCGKIEEVFADMIEMGVDIWNPCQPCNDLAALKKLFAGKITFCGGIDSQFVLDRPGVTTDDVRTEVRQRIDQLAEKGGYIAAPSHGVPYDQKIIDAMNNEIITYGKKFYSMPLEKIS